MKGDKIVKIQYSDPFFTQLFGLSNIYDTNFQLQDIDISSEYERAANYGTFPPQSF